MKPWLALLVAVAVIGCGPAIVDKAGGPTPAPSPLTLTLETPFSRDGIDGFVTSVDRTTKGSIRLDIAAAVQGGQVDAEAATIARARSGAADLVIVGTRSLTAAGITALDALHAPFLIDSYPLERAVLADPTVADAVVAIDGDGLVGIGVLPGDLRYVLARDEPFLRPASFAGARVAMSASAIGDRFYRALDARPSPIAAGTSIAAFDAVEVPIAAVAGNHYDETHRFLGGNVIPWPRPAIVLMAKAAFERLTADQRDVLRAAVIAALEPSLDWLEQTESESLMLACRHGISVQDASADDLAALRAATQSVTDELRTDPATRELLDQIDRIKTRTSAPIHDVWCAGSPVESRRPTPTPSPDAGPLDGAWTACPTAAQIVAAGGLPGEAESNAGCVTLTFDRGVFRERGASAAGGEPGTYDVDGTRLTIHRANAEIFSFEWSVFDGLLILRPAPSGVSPAPWLAVPFTPAPG